MAISNDMISGHRKLHFVLLPWLTTSHMIPMIDIGRMLAERGVTVTIVTTPANAVALKPTIARIADSGLPIKFVPLPFRSVEAGLPDGCEIADNLPAFDMLPNLYNAAKLLRQPLELLLREQSTPLPPSCILSGMCYPWVTEVARDLGIPCFIFHGFGSFAIYCMHNLYSYKPHEGAASATEPFEIPGLPFQFEITRQHLPIFFQSMPKFMEMCKEVREGELEMDGVIINSFDDLEPQYAEQLAGATGQKILTIGPVSMCHRESSDMADRGRELSVDATRCLQWLDSMKPQSVIYVSFGSVGSFSPAQLMELGHGLLAANRAFIWVVNGVQRFPSEVQRWLQENFEEGGADSRCLLIRGWAPQVLILSHPAVGGFMTHCGWNSTLESASAGVPMATWPLFAEQFLNEKLIVDVIGIGVAVGAKTAVQPFAPDDKASVKRETIADAVERLMDGGEEGEERRRRAKELKEKAREAVEMGGSSFNNITLLMEFAKQPNN
ncbi:hypothetical protein Cni_G27725 [Canna indica]|uniref:Glycosyltransferase n=1 Tax=Canna indica TaxID=4628 RepID=A0AAQ3QRL7_9LILI|nr:hypothetical protein Cni_G27725 [Canna indica]